jgi:hypothetical protein
MPVNGVDTRARMVRRRSRRQPETNVVIGTGSASEWVAAAARMIRRRALGNSCWLRICEVKEASQPGRGPEIGPEADGGQTSTASGRAR